MTEERNSSFGNYGNAFQEHLVYLLLTDKKYANEMHEILELDYFDVEHLKFITKEYFSYRAKYSTFPSLKIFRGILTDNKKINPALHEKIQQFFVGAKFNSGDDAYVMERATDFCRIQKIKGALIDILDLLKKPNVENSYPEIEVALKNALKFGSDRDLGIMFSNEALLGDILETGKRVTIPTGWRKMDEVLRGGIGKKELIVFMGGTGAGKSHTLINLGANVVKGGGTVLHYTLELSATQTALRYASNFSDIPIDELRENKQAVIDVSKNLTGKLIIKEFATKTANPSSIKNHYLKTKAVLGFVPDLIIIDYADLLRAPSNKEKRFELEDIYETIRGYAMEEDIAVATASQVHRSAMEDEIITIGSIAEAFAKVMVSDIVVTISRRAEDKVLGKGKFFVAKNRCGPDGVVMPITLDPTRSKIMVEDY